MHEGPILRGHQELLQMLLQRYSPLALASIYAFLLMQQGPFGPTRQHAFQQRVSFLQG